MNSRTLAVLAVRLIAIYLIVVGITYLPSAASLLMSGTQGVDPIPLIALATAFICAPFIVGILLWWLAPKLGCRIVKAELMEGPAAPSNELVQGAIAVAGLVIASTAIPGIVWALAEVFHNTRHDFLTDELYILIDRLLVGLVGLALIVGARRLRRWIFNLREIGT